MVALVVSVSVWVCLFARSILHAWADGELDLTDDEGEPGEEKYPGFEHVRLENSDVWLWVHLPDRCVGEHCTIHNRSDHHMRDMPQHWRGDRNIMERICSHGVGHPDPDEIASNTIHGCCSDGCCMGPVSAVDPESNPLIDTDIRVIDGVDGYTPEMLRHRPDAP